jgi:hypothetical protein
MGSEPRYPSMNNVLAKKENANTHTADLVKQQYERRGVS